MANRRDMAAAVVTARKAARELLHASGVSLASAGEIWKAKSDPPVACYDSLGRLIGFADPDDVQPVAGEAPPETGTPARMQELQDAHTVGPKQHPKAGKTVLTTPAPVKAPPTEVVGPDGQTVTGDEAIQKADGRFRALLRRGTVTQERQLRDGVARIATKIAYEHNVPIRTALHIAKSSLVESAASVPNVAKAGAVAEAHRLAIDNVIAYAAIRDRYRPITG